MNTSRLRGGRTARQDEDRLLGRYEPKRHIRLSLHATADDGTAVLHRHRVNLDARSDIAAIVIHSGGVVREIAWDEYHRTMKDRSWIVPAEHWIKATIAGNWARTA